MRKKLRSFKGEQEKSFRPEKYSEQDIKQSAWEKTLELWRAGGSAFWGSSNGELLTPLPRFPGAPYIRMLPVEREFWEGPMAGAWRGGKAAFLREAVPTLAGKREDIPERVRQHQRNEWRTIARQKEILDDSSVQVEIRGSVHREDPEHTAIARFDYYRAYRIAEKRWGKRGRIFLDQLRNERSVDDASTQAGVTRQMGYKYLKELKKALSFKK